MVLPKHFDIEGHTDFDMNRRVVALSLADLKHIPHDIAVACGVQKRRSILGALRGNYINVLATDSAAAEAVIKEADKVEVPQPPAR